jgi:hypothetical protein
MPVCPWPRVWPKPFLGGSPLPFLAEAHPLPGYSAPANNSPCPRIWLISAGVSPYTAILDTAIPVGADKSGKLGRHVSISDPRRSPSLSPSLRRPMVYSAVIAGSVITSSDNPPLKSSLTANSSQNTRSFCGHETIASHVPHARLSKLKYDLVFCAQMTPFVAGNTHVT